MLGLALWIIGGNGGWWPGTVPSCCSRRDWGCIQAQGCRAQRVLARIHLAAGFVHKVGLRCAGVVGNIASSRAKGSPVSSKNRDRAGAVRVPTNKQTNKTTLSSYVGKVRVSANGRASGLLMGGEMSERGVVAFGKATASFRGRVRADISHRGGLFQRRAVRIGQKLAQSWPKMAGHSKTAVQLNASAMGSPALAGVAAP